MPRPEARRAPGGGARGRAVRRAREGARVAAPGPRALVGGAHERNFRREACGAQGARRVAGGPGPREPSSGRALGAGRGTAGTRPAVSPSVPPSFGPRDLNVPDDPLLAALRAAF